MGALSFIQVAADSVGKKVRTYLGADGNHSETAVIVDTEGVQQATAAAPLRVDPVGTTTQPVSGTVGVNNFPATQPVSGTVSVGNFPATQPVTAANQDPSFVAPGSAVPTLGQVVEGTDGALARIIRLQPTGETRVTDDLLYNELRMIRYGLTLLLREYGQTADLEDIL